MSIFGFKLANKRLNSKEKDLQKITSEVLQI